MMDARAAVIFVLLFSSVSFGSVELTVNGQQKGGL